MHLDTVGQKGRTDACVNLLDITDNYPTTRGKHRRINHHTIADLQ